MPTEVRVGDSVNFRTADGKDTTAVVTAVNDQDDVDLEYWGFGTGGARTAVSNATRATSLPPSDGEFWDFA
jgi:hypothetical protein